MYRSRRAQNRPGVIRASSRRRAGSTLRAVAIKLLDRGALRDDTAKARFLREGQIAAMLTHPSVVRTYDVVDVDFNRTAIVMELVTGETLSDVVRGAGIAAARTVAIALDLLSALTAFARHGVSRIDPNPSYVIMRKDDAAETIDRPWHPQPPLPKCAVVAGSSSTFAASEHTRGARSRRSLPDARRPHNRPGRHARRDTNPRTAHPIGQGGLMTPSGVPSHGPTRCANGSHPGTGQSRPSTTPGRRCASTSSWRRWRFDTDQGQRPIPFRTSACALSISSCRFLVRDPTTRSTS